MPEPALLTLTESGRYLGGKSRDYIYWLIEQGLIDSVFLSQRARRVTRESLDRYIEALVQNQTQSFVPPIAKNNASTNK